MEMVVSPKTYFKKLAVRDSPGKPVCSRAAVVLLQHIMAADLLSYTIPLDSPISRLEATQAFKGLTDRERLYCHYLSRAAWEGGQICLLQTSPESPPLFLLLREVFSRQSVVSLREAVKESFTDDEFKVRHWY